MRSIAVQLQWGLIWVALLISGIGIALHFQARNLLVGELDRGLSLEIDGLVSSLRLATSPESLRALNDDRSGFAAGEDRAFELRGLDGELLARSASLAALDLELTGGSLSATAKSPRWQTLPDGTPVRVVQRVLELPHLQGRESVVLLVARNAKPLRGVLYRLAALTAIAGLTLLSLLALLQWLLVRRALAPLRQLVTDLASLDAPKPLSPKRLQQAPTELQPLMHALQQALSRIEQAYQREQQFAAAAAHELRTPIAELMTLTDVALRLQPNLSRAHAGLEQAREVAQRLAALIAALLPLASTGTKAHAPQESIELNGWLHSVLRERGDQDRDLAARLVWQADAPRVVATDFALLRALVDNLLENAISHAPKASRIEVSVSDATGHAWFSICNDAPDLLPADLPRIFDPFWRKTVVREGDGHFGLGLSVAQRLAEPLGLRLRANLDASNRLRIDVVEHIIKA